MSEVKTMQGHTNHRRKQASKYLGCTTSLALTAAFAVTLFMATPTQAASDTFLLDQPNRLVDGIYYLIKNDTTSSHVTASDGSNGVLFAAYVGGLKRHGYGDSHYGHGGNCRGCFATDNNFGGDEKAPAPLPAAALLMGFGLLGLAGIAKRGKRVVSHV
jgi:hypothetical protein